MAASTSTGEVREEVVEARGPRLSPRRQVLAAALLYAAYAIFATWPLALDPGGSIYGVPGGDLTGGISNLRELVEQRVFPFAPARIEDFDAPFGQAVQWVLNLATAPSSVLLLALGYCVGATAAFAAFMLIGFVLSGTAMFLLARWLTGSPWAALVAGFGFAFYPFAINKGLDHTHFVHGWPFALMAWRLLEIVNSPTRRNGLLAGAATALAMWWTPYYILFGAVLFATIAVVVLIAGKLRRTAGATLGSLAAAAVVVAAFVAVFGTLQVVAGSDAGGTQENELNELITFSARPHEYALPDRNSLLFGERTEPYLTSHLHGSTFSENSLYLGLTLLALALAGLLVAVARGIRGGRAALTDQRTVAAVAAALAALVAAAFSMPPEVTVGGRLVKFPMWFVFEVTPTFRSVSRFVIVVQMGVCVLAAFGLAALLERRRAAARGAITALALVIVAVDLWAKPPDAVTELAPPAVYERMASLGAGIVAEYPVQPGDIPNSTAMLWQEVHGHPILQGYTGDSEEESRKLELARLDDDETPGDLAALGVRWALVRPDDGTGTAGRGFRKVSDDPEGSVYEVTAPPSRTQVDALSGFGDPEGDADEQYRWLTAPEGRVLVRGACDPCRGRLRFQASSHLRRRTLTIRDPSGRVLAREPVPAAPTRISVPLVVDRTTVLTFSVAPAPEAAGGPDPRTLGVLVREPRFVLERSP